MARHRMVEIGRRRAVRPDDQGHGKRRHPHHPQGAPGQAARAAPSPAAGKGKTPTAEVAFLGAATTSGARTKKTRAAGGAQGRAESRARRSRPPRPQATARIFQSFFRPLSSSLRLLARDFFLGQELKGGGIFLHKGYGGIPSMQREHHRGYEQAKG